MNRKRKSHRKHKHLLMWLNISFAINHLRVAISLSNSKVHNKKGIMGVSTALCKSLKSVFISLCWARKTGKRCSDLLRCTNLTNSLYKSNEFLSQYLPFFPQTQPEPLVRLSVSSLH